MNLIDKAIRRVLITFVAVFLVAGCASKPGIEGKWSGNVPLDSGGLGIATYEFLPDGIVTMAATKGKPAPGKQPKLNIAELILPGLANIASIHVAGTYNVKNDVLTIVPKQFTVRDRQGHTPSLAPTLTWKKEAQVNRFKIDGQTLTLDKLDGDKPLVLTRQNPK